MTRLAEDIDLLSGAMKIAAGAIWQEESVSVPLATLDVVAERIADRRGRPAEYMLIRDEAVWLVQAARNVAIYREDANASMVERWTRLAELLAAGVALDLENAKKSLGEIDP